MYAPGRSPHESHCRFAATSGSSHISTGKEFRQFTPGRYRFAVRENPRPTRHLEHVEPELFGKPVPGSISGPAWDLVPLPGPPDPPVVGEPPPSGDSASPAAPSGAGWPPPSDDVWLAPSAEAAPVPSVDVWPPPSDDAPPTPPGERSWKRPALAIGGAVLAALVLGIGGLALLGQLRPDDADTTPAVELADLELPITVPQDPASDGPSGPSRSAGSEPRRSEAPGTGNGAVLSPPGDAAAASGTQPGQGGTSEGGADTGAGPSTGGSTGGDTGSSSGSTTPTATAPPPTSAPTSTPTSKPTPKPTPSATGGPTPDPTPTPSVSPTPEPSDAPVSPGTGQ